VQVVAANVARDHFRSSYSKRRGGNQLEGISEDFVPPAGENSPGSARVIERAVLIEEIRSNLDFALQDLITNEVAESSGFITAQASPHPRLRLCPELA